MTIEDYKLSKKRIELAYKVLLYKKGKQCGNNMIKMGILSEGK